MPLAFSNDRLLDVMNGWRLNHVAAGVILVDETSTGTDVSGDRAGRQRLQAALLVRATRFGFPLFVVEFGLNGNLGYTGVFAGGLSAELDAVIPGGTNFYQKGPMESNGFDNVQLGPDVQNQGITDLVIMGQSVNACCAATARGAAALGISVHTCESLVRGGAVATAPLKHFRRRLRRLAQWDHCLLGVVTPPLQSRQRPETTSAINFDCSGNRANADR